MACANCGDERPTRRVLIRALLHMAERCGCRDIRQVPPFGDLVDEAEGEIARSVDHERAAQHEDAKPKGANENK